MTWREAIKIVAEDVRVRATRCAEGPHFGSPPDEGARAAQELRFVAEKLEDIATRPPHEGLRELRKLKKS